MTPGIGCGCVPVRGVGLGPMYIVWLSNTLKIKSKGEEKGEDVGKEKQREEGSRSRYLWCQIEECAVAVESLCYGSMS